MGKDNIGKLLEDSLRACCSQCRNWQKVGFLGGTYYGCACNMDARICTLNPLAQQLKEQREKQ